MIFFYRKLCSLRMVGVVSSTISAVFLAGCEGIVSSSELQCDSMSNQESLEVERNLDAIDYIEEVVTMPRFGGGCQERCVRVNIWLSSQYGERGFQLEGQPGTAWDGLVIGKNYRFDLIKIDDDHASVEGSYQHGDRHYVVTRFPLPVDRVRRIRELIGSLPESSCAIKSDPSVLDHGVAYLRIEEAGSINRYIFPFDDIEWRAGSTNSRLEAIGQFIRESMRTDR